MLAFLVTVVKFRRCKNLKFIIFTLLLYQILIIELKKEHQAKVLSTSKKPLRIVTGWKDKRCSLFQALSF